MWEVRQGDCLERMGEMADASVDLICTDPPYGLEFMGKAWDSFKAGDVAMRRNPQLDAVNAGMSRQGGRQRQCAGYQKRQAADMRAFQLWCTEWAAMVLRVAKPGAHLFAFGGTRTFHRLACAMEDAGWEIRDCLMWVYGSGFPKSLDVAKAIDKAVGAVREVVGNTAEMSGRTVGHGTSEGYAGGIVSGHCRDITVPATAEAREWDGWGTALKPAWEPIILARKALEGTVAQNVQKWGVGALNIDGCRVGSECIKITGHRPGQGYAGKAPPDRTGSHKWNGNEEKVGVGRWPANLCHDGSQDVLELFPQGVSRRSDTPQPVKTSRGHKGGAFGNSSACRPDGHPVHAQYVRGGFDDAGSAARFFYCAKASQRERELGLDGIEIVWVDYTAWDGEECQARLRVDTAQSPPRVTVVSGTPDNDATAWSTLLFGSPSTAPSLQVGRSTTVTATGSTTKSRTLSWLLHWITSASTAVVRNATENGGSPAASVAHGTRSLIITSEQTGSRLGAVGAASLTRLTISESGASPADHPTVKPLALMRYLIRLGSGPTPGLVLDPFLGSGSTGIAALLEGQCFLGIEREAEYVEIARRRITNWEAWR